ncbi:MULTISPECIES: DMT family transporter [unclassified Chelatococcus]|uniref:DMT family transporter n=1 Tax=unclassified Chelatococcus TaxID=2638111 RepID=UPI0002F51484|nr:MULTISPECIES: DMT family transporter [unclassified Chelatococcus]
MATAADNRRGIVAMLGAMALFCCNDTLVKLATSAYPASQILAVRGLFAVVAATVLAFALGQVGSWRGLRNPMLLLRAFLEAAVAFTFITALAHIPLGNITAILQATPILMTMIAAMVGLETVGWRRWCAVFVGFCGVLLIVKPDMAGFDAWALIALGAAALAAMRDLVTRQIRAEVSTGLVTIASAAAVPLVGLALAPTQEWQPIDARATGFLAGAAVLVSLGNYCLIVACRGTDVSIVSSFRYSVVVWAILLGFLVWGELPDALAMAGTGLIVAAGVYTIHRERVRMREARAGATAQQPQARPVAAGQP